MWRHSCPSSMYVLDAVNPFVLLLRCGGGDTVDHVVSFDHSPIGLCLARLDQLTTVVGDVQLKTVLRKTNNKNFNNNNHL